MERIFTDDDQLVEYLNRLNDSGAAPEVAGHDNYGRPLIVWLFEVGGDEVWPNAALLAGEKAEDPELVSPKLDELAYPVTVLAHPDDLLGED